MSYMPWNHLFFASTRGRIVLLLRRANHTVDELAQELNLTDNAVRAHLTALERDGLAQQAGVRRGSGKPAVIYKLTIEAERLFAQAYAPVLQQLLEVLSTSLSTGQLEEIMRNAGQRLAAQWSIPPGELRARLQVALTILNELGGLAELEEIDGAYAIQGYSCPLASVVSGHPEVCQLTRTLLAELVGTPIEEQCTRGEHARCRFVTEKA